MILFFAVMMPKKRKEIYSLFIGTVNKTGKNRHFHAPRFDVNITSLNGQFREYKTQEGGPINNDAKVIKFLLLSNYFSRIFPDLFSISSNYKHFCKIHKK